MQYTYNEIEALRQGASFLATMAGFLAFFGGYWSAEKGWWWLVFFTLFIYKFTHGFLEPLRHGGKDPYERLLRHGASLIIAGLFSLFFLFGYWSGSRHLWFLGFLMVAVYFLSLRFIQKAR